MKPLFYIAAFLCFSVLAKPGLAEKSNFYEVEVIIFSNELKMYREEESWPLPEQVTFATPWLFLKNIPATQVYPELAGKKSHTKEYAHYLPVLPNSDKDLNFAEEKIRLAGRHRLLFHKTWLQNITDEANAKPIAITAGIEQNGYYEVFGTITLSLSKYLHVKTDLWRVIFSEDEQAISMRLPLVTQDWQAPAVEEHAEAMLVETSADDWQQLTTPRISLVSAMKQSRRMRSREVHFIDHPLFGVLIEIRPIVLEDQGE